MVLQTKNITALAEHLNMLEAAAREAAFWSSCPDIWFSFIELQFAAKNIKVDLTKCYHAITALHKSVAEQISAFICNTPTTTDMYRALKADLISIYGLTQTDKDSRLLAIFGLGDHKLSALLHYLNSLTSVQDRTQPFIDYYS